MDSIARLTRHYSHTRTMTPLKQCAWCGAVEISGAFYLRHRLPIIKWAYQFSISSWLLVTLGVTHGVCGDCVSSIKSARRTA